MVSDPAAEVFLDHGGQRIHMRGLVVEAGDIGELLAAGMLEGFLDFLVDLFERLDAVGREGRRDHRDLLLSLFRQLGDVLDRVGLEPFLGAEDRLEGRVDPVLVPAEPFAQQTRGLLALAMVEFVLELAKICKYIMTDLILG